VRHHGGAVELDDQQHGFDRDLPFRDLLLGLGELLNIFRGILKGDEFGGLVAVEKPKKPARSLSSEQERKPERQRTARWR
jgi:hypothetical protein